MFKISLVVLLVMQVVWQMGEAANIQVQRGSGHIKFLVPQERVWAGLSDGHRRYPVIHSGNLIALRLAYTSGSYSYRWMQCGSSSSYCYYSNCPRGKVLKSNRWSSCRKEQFYIRAVNKNDGQPIISGDFVTLAPYNRGSTCRLRCFSSSSSYCNSKTCVSESYFKGNNAFIYSYLTFQIFSRYAKDGIDPVQYGDIVAFRYPYYYSHYWLYFSGSYLYARSCSHSYKTNCARKNSLFGFQIFKKL
ncbi:uncharacterized protein LOC110237687 isoform X1 [Exaiptasia diaphana]|uniref:Uncharacterized protein n=1 Tax=Exaiptasia diaphana TaxID=2652724 RepID=A0A913X4X7_EXADI|nr:uncharacterized protein LOC110237687 isoform X1 [Exaiptasia diaphana]